MRAVRAAAAAGVLLLAGCAAPSQGPAPAPPRGAKLYASMCAVCHGPAGEGYKADRAPALANPDFLASASEDFLYRAVADGRPGTTMSAWSKERGGPLSPADIEALIAYMRSWSSREPAALDLRPATGDAAHGAARYAAQCARCHGPSGMEGPELRIGSPDYLKNAGDGFLRLAIRNGRAQTEMAGFGGDLGDAGIEDVVAYLRSLQNHSAPRPALNSVPTPFPWVPCR